LFSYIGTVSHICISTCTCYNIFINESVLSMLRRVDMNMNDDINMSDDMHMSDDMAADISDSDSDDENIVAQVVPIIRSVQSSLLCAALLASDYYFKYHEKNGSRIAGQSGYGWVMDTLETPGGSHHMFRMNASLFHSLHDLLVSSYGLKSSIHMSSMESLAIFLVTCGHGWSNSALCNIFRHSGETISRKFHEVLHCVVAMCKAYIRPIDPNFSTTHSRITDDDRMMSHFKDCIGALDGSHIMATPPPEDLIRYIGRSGKATQNVLVVVDFDMRFIYASVGQPGSMHDTNVLFHALKNDNDNFPHPPVGKYYCVDAGYPNRPGYLAPYKGQRYHIPDWRRGQLLMVSKNILTICIRVFAMWWSVHLEFGK
jgi:hypothetical protein